MAGTITIGVRPVHIYQRRFDSADLAVALQNSHLYLITRRPQVRLDPASVLSKPYGVKVDVVSRREGHAEEWRQRIVIPAPDGEVISSFRLHADGSYFSLSSGERTIHGDAWAFASFFMDANEEIAGQEVMYVGKAYGQDGSSNVWERTRKHETLSRIYEDHLPGGWDVFVTPLEVEYATMSSADHINDYDDGPDLFGAYYGRYVEMETGRVLGPGIDLAEHAMIAYFVPHYNKNLLEWCAAKPTKDMQTMRSGGFRLLHVHFNGWWGLSRFYSRQVPAKVRSHLISHDLPPNPSSSVTRGIGSADLVSWRAQLSLVANGHEIFASDAERAGVALRVFGERAPEERRPPEVILDR